MSHHHDDDVLLSAKQIAPMLGYEASSYKAVYAVLDRAGVQGVTLGERRRRWRRSTILAFMHQGSAPVPRREQPESTPTRFRKRSA